MRGAELQRPGEECLRATAIVRRLIERSEVKGNCRGVRETCVRFLEPIAGLRTVAPEERRHGGAAKEERRLDKTRHGLSRFAQRLDADRVVADRTAVGDERRVIRGRRSR